MNAVYLQFADGRVVRGHGYRVLMDAMFKQGTTTGDLAFFLFGTMVDVQAFEADWILETLRAIKCQEATLFKLVPRDGGSVWTAARYRRILTEDPEVTELYPAGDLYRRLCIGEETDSDDDLPREPELPGVVSRWEGGVRPPDSPGLLKSVGRALHRWAFGR